MIFIMTKRVLLAEDEPNIVEPLTFLLERAGFDVAVETDGRKALHAALADTPDVMILDVMLPELDGYEVLRRLRADRRAETLPVLVLTAKGQREDRESGRRQDLRHTARARHPHPHRRDRRGRAVAPRPAAYRRVQPKPSPRRK